MQALALKVENVNVESAGVVLELVSNQAAFTEKFVADTLSDAKNMNVLTESVQEVLGLDVGFIKSAVTFKTVAKRVMFASTKSDKF